MFLFRAFLLLSAIGVAFIPSAQRSLLLIILEMSASFAIVTIVFLKKDRYNYAWRIAASALLAGDIFYFFNHNAGILPTWLFPMEETAFLVYIVAATCYLLRTSSHNSRFTKGEAGVFFLLFSGFAFLSAKYVLFPFFHSGNYATPFFYITSTIYHFTESGVIALAVLLAMKARSRHWFYMTHGIVLLSISAIALGYSAGVVLGNTIPFLGCGEFWGLLMVLAAQTYDDQADVPFAKWNSVRVRMVWLIFLFNVALLLLLYFLQVLFTQNAFQLTTLLFVVFGLWLVANLIAFHTSENIYLLLDNLQDTQNISTVPRFRLNIYEVELFAAKLRVAYNTIQVQSQMASFAKLSAQVAHDIRSPLAALDSVLKDISQLPEEKRIIVRSAVGRIRDIANNLIEKNRQLPRTAGAAALTSSAAAGAEPATAQLLSSLIDALISEKRMQFRSKIGVEIDARLGASSYGLFAKIQPAEFKRVISNLVNNSVEVLTEARAGSVHEVHGRQTDKGGSVIVELSHDDGKITVKVIDTGKGIPPALLAKLGRRGETHGKPGGSGLGLYHARTSLESWGGAMEIDSQAGKGTTVTLTLPAARPPEWFVSRLELRPDSTVVILDDDTSIHQVWQGRFDSLGSGRHGLEIRHFSEPEKLRGWVKDDPSNAGRAVYLFDYELLGYQETGLSLAQELELAPKVILVTSRYEEPQVLADCLRLGVRMIPKGLAGLVPIRIAPGTEGMGENRGLKDTTIAAAPVSRPLSVLIDDDMLVHMNWKMAAKAAGVDLIAYKTPEEFSAGIADLPRDTPIYLDSELGNEIKGEDLAKELHEKGFTNLTMATGYGPEKFAHLSWLKVSDKEPPFGGNIA
jgi:signal transduction histidine kinase